MTRVEKNDKERTAFRAVNLDIVSFCGALDLVNYCLFVCLWGKDETHHIFKPQTERERERERKRELQSFASSSAVG